MTREQLHLWTDEELRRRACDRYGSTTGRQAASVLLERYHARVFQWCNAQLRDPSLAQDAAQDVLVRAYRGLDSFAGKSRFSSWLFAIARNRCLDELRRPRLSRDERDIGELADSAANPAEEFETKASLESWNQLLARHLEPVEQEAMVLRYIECMPVAEITCVLEISTSSGARGVLQQARRKLRAAFAGKGDLEHD